MNGLASGVMRKGEMYTREIDIHPKVEPISHPIGMKANAWAIFVASVSSPIMLFTAPTLPFNKPHIQRLKGLSPHPGGESGTDLITSSKKVVERPKKSIEIHKPESPMSTTGFRPTRSDIRLHCITAMDWVTKKRDSYDKIVVPNVVWDQSDSLSDPRSNLSCACLPG